MATRSLLDEIDRRLALLENPPKQDMPEWFDDIENRLSVLEHPGAKSANSTSKDGRDWIRVPKYNEECWVYYPNGEIYHGRVDDFDKGYTHIMPYIPGDKKPEPPKGE
jgi:hypothetical protein